MVKLCKENSWNLKKWREFHCQKMKKYMMWEFCEDIWMYFIGNELFILFGMNMRLVPSDFFVECGWSSSCDFVSIRMLFITSNFSEFIVLSLSICFFWLYLYLKCHRYSFLCILTQLEKWKFFFNSWKRSLWYDYLLSKSCNPWFLFISFLLF